MTDDIQGVGADTPIEALVPAPVPPQSTPDQPQNSPAPFSLLALFALIAGLTGPVLACVGSVIIALQARANDQMPLIVSLLLIAGFIGLPLAWQAWRRLQGHYAPEWQPRWLWGGVGVVALIVLLGLGQLFVSLNWAPAYALAIIQPLIFVAGAVILLAVAAGGRTGLSQLRAWGSFVSGAWFSVSIAIVVELFLAILLVVAVMAVLASVAPDQAQEIIALFRSAQRNNIDEQAAMHLLLQPWVIILAYLVVSVAIPFIEEFLKPIGVVLLIGKKPKPSAAFWSGLLGGLGFAVLESLSNLINIQDPWIVLVVARLGTLVMHGFGAGLVGWGWGQFAQGKPHRLALAYLGAVTIHGLWNGAVVTFVFAGLGMANSPNSVGLGALLVLGVLLIIALMAGCIGGLIWIGYRLRTSPLEPLKAES